MEGEELKEHEEASNGAQAPVPYIIHEGAMARMERTAKRLWILVIILIVLLAASNAAWLAYESQFEDQTTITQDVDTQQSPAYVNGTGEMTVNGQSSPNDN